MGRRMVAVLLVVGIFLVGFGQIRRIYYERQFHRILAETKVPLRDWKGEEKENLRPRGNLDLGSVSPAVLNAAGKLSFDVLRGPWQNRLPILSGPRGRTTSVDFFRLISSGGSGFIFIAQFGTWRIHCKIDWLRWI